MGLIDGIKNFGKAASSFLFGNAQEEVHGLFVGLYPSTSGEPPRRGTKELLEAYNTMPWLRAVVNKVSRSVASTGWHLYVASNNGKAFKAANIQYASFEARKQYLKQQEVVKEVVNHPLLDLLNSGNSFMTGMIVRQIMQIYLDLTGEVFMLMERNNAGIPIAMWPIPPNWVVDTPTPSNPMYRVSYQSFNTEIPETEILWIVDPDPVNPFGRGSGMAKALADELETDEYAAKHTKAWFYNRARPDVIVSADGLTPEDTKRLEQDWINKNQGFWRVYKPYFLSKKVEVQTLNQTFENMQLVELRKYERDTIIHVYGVPPEILGIVESSNRATIEASDYLYSRWVIQPRLELLRSYLQEKLVPEFDERLILEYDNPIPEDKEYALRVAQASPWSLTVDEWREMGGHGKLEDKQGALYPIPYNIYFSTGFGAAPPVEEETQPKSVNKTEKVFISDEGEFIRRILASIGEAILKYHLAPVYEDIVGDFGERTVLTIGARTQFDLTDPRVLHFLKTEAGTFITKINETTREEIRKQLTEGVEAGESIDHLADRINSVFDMAQTRRSVVIARTETIRASNFGSFEGMKQSDVEEKEWLATRDDRTRDEHAEMDGQIQPIDKPFISPDGEEAMYPGDFGVPELDINCRCTVAPVFGGKRMLDTEEKRFNAWKMFDRHTRRWEKKMLEAVRAAFKEQQEAVMNELKGGKE